MTQNPISIKSHRWHKCTKRWAYWVFRLKGEAKSPILPQNPPFMRQWTPAELNMLRQLYENMQDGNPVREVIIEYEEEGKTEQIHITDPRLVKIMTHAAMEVYGKNKNP